MINRNKIALALVLFAGTFVSQVKAQYLIVVDDSNPNAVLFTATGANAIASASSHTYAQGIILTGFAPANLFVPSVMATNTSLVAAADGTPTYTSAQSGTVNGVAGIEISGTSGATPSGNIEHFVAGAPAFGGTATFNLANATFPFVLPADGTVGNIYSGLDGLFTPAPVLVGTYIVRNAATPEPGTMALMLIGALGLFGFMRTKSRVVCPAMRA